MIIRLTLFCCGTFISVGREFGVGAMEDAGYEADDFAELAERERTRLQRNAVKQGFISALEEAKVAACQAAYRDAFAAALDESRAAAAAEALAVLRGDVPPPK